MPPEEVENTQETEEETPETEETEETQTVDPPAAAVTGEQKATPLPTSSPSFHELKVVIIMKGESVMLGVQSTDCDPVYTTMQGDLAAALQRVPALVDEAKKKWTANPLYPKANLPEPPPTPTPVRQTSGKATTPAAAPKKQPTFF
jgi:hypothetical protein